ncbi:hypothetical protein E4U25_000688, partial [Claviceps purpurea]
MEKWVGNSGQCQGDGEGSRLRGIHRSSPQRGRRSWPVAPRPATRHLAPEQKTRQQSLSDDIDNAKAMVKEAVSEAFIAPPPQRGRRSWPVAPRPATRHLAPERKTRQQSLSDDIDNAKAMVKEA